MTWDQDLLLLVLKTGYMKIMRNPMSAFKKPRPILFTLGTLGALGATTLTQ